MIKVLFLISFLFWGSCQKQVLSDNQKRITTTHKETYFEVKRNANRVRIVASANMKEGKLNIVILDANNNLLMQNSYSERFRFSRVYNNPAEGTWYVRAKYESSKGSYKIRIYVE